MYRLLVFDLDSTLAPIGSGMGKKELKLFRKLENSKINIAICSGKSCDYLCGFMRQIGCKAPILIGENGAIIRFGIELPPSRYYRVPYSDKATLALQEIKQLLMQRFPHIWFQPNKVGVTPFPTSEQEFDEIQNILDEWQKGKDDITVFRHVDSYDIVPAGIDKSVGIRYVLEMLDIASEEMIAIGDGVNDYCMFEMAGYSVGVNVKEDFRVDKNCNSTLEMLEHLHTIIGP